MGGTPLDAAIATLGDGQLYPDQLAYAEALVRGVYEHRYALDNLLESLVKDYSWERVAAVDRGILRIGAYELLHMPHLPPAVTLNEAIEIAKKFSTAESGKFVNGVLASVLAGCDKANWDPSEHPADLTETPEPQEPEPEEEQIEAGEEADKLLKVGAWKIRGAKKS